MASAYEAAERSKPDVRVAALLRIARVQTALDRGQARRTFEQALDEIRLILGRDATFFLEHARFLAAAIAPDLLPSIPVQIHRPRHLDADSLGGIMIEHGNLEAAMELAMRYDDASTFPFSLANMLMDRVSEQERLALLRRAVEAWREGHGDMFVSLFQFVWLFQHRWKLLPEEEARDVVREVVRVTLSEPDKPTESTYDQEGTIKITSLHEPDPISGPSYSPAFGAAVAGIAAKRAPAVCGSRPTFPLRHGIDPAGGSRTPEIRRREARWLRCVRSSRRLPIPQGADAGLAGWRFRAGDKACPRTVPE